MLMKDWIQQEDITIINIYSPNRDHQNIWSKNWQNEKIDNSTIIGGEFNTTLSIMDRTIRQKIIKEIEDSMP